MDLARFSAIVSAYGADPRRWPAAERAAAVAFAARPEAAALLAQECALDALLDADRLDDALSPAAMASIPRSARARHDSWRIAAALAACAVLGVALGYGGVRQAAHADIADTVLEDVFGQGIGG